MIFYYLLITVLPLVKHPLWSLWVGEFTIVKYLGILCTLYAVFYSTTRSSAPSFFATTQAKLFGVFFGIATFSYLFNGQSFSWSAIYMTYLSLFIYFFITLTVVDSEVRLRKVLLVAIGSVAVASIYVIREWQKYHLLFDYSYRPGWVTGDPNFFTISALACLPIGFYLLMEDRSWLTRIYCSGCLLLTFVAITLAASRGGFLGMSVTFLFMVWHSRTRVRNLMLIGMVVIPFLIVRPPEALDRLLHPTHSDVESTGKRETLWRGGLNMIATHPLTGVGLGNFKRVATGYQESDEQVEMVAHNSYIEIAAEMGVPALLLFIGIFVSSIRSLQRVRREFPRQDFLHQTALGMQAALLGSALAITFVSGQYQKLVWLILMLTMVMQELVVARRRARPEAMEPAAAAGMTALEEHVEAMA